MSNCKLRLLTVLALAAVPALPAQAQQVIRYSDAQGYGYRAEPLYPYVAQPAGRAYPYVSTQPVPAARPVAKVDPALVEELRKGRKHKASAKTQATEPEAQPLANKKITKTIVIREKPVVRKTYRVVDDPPIIVQREISEDQILPPQGHAELPPTGRTIRAEAEVTITGPDRMSIRLFRKRDGSDANASDKQAPKRDAKAETKTKIR